MIRKFIDRILGKAPPPPPLPAGVVLGTRVEIPASEHGIDPKLIGNEPAVKVVETLKQEGYEAYIVGGAVRDLLVGLKPKDFDVATNATPEQVKQLFRRAFIVGRRFRLVHVIHGRGRDQETIEVSTFRAYMDPQDATQVEGNEKTSKAELADKHHAVDASGRVLRDNVWGPQVEDAARRDFTVNAMYYDPQARIVVDYHGGFHDAKARVLRMIGDPVTRYREDPVRILRVLRFAAKLGFDIEAKTAAPIREMKALLANVPISRMFDELIKLLQTGHALASLESLKRFGLDRGVFPILDAHFDGIARSPDRESFVNRALADTDRRVQEGKPVVPSFLMSSMFWYEVRERWQQARHEGHPSAPALATAIDQTFDARIGDISGRGKLAADMREIWGMQPRFEKRTGSAPIGLLRQARFRAGLDFLRLRAEAGEGELSLVSWWEAFAAAGEDGQKEMLEALRTESQQRQASKVANREAAKAGGGRKRQAAGDGGEEGGEEGGEGGGGGGGRGGSSGSGKKAELIRQIAELTEKALKPDATEAEKVLAMSQIEKLQKAASGGGRRRRGGKKKKEAGEAAPATAATASRGGDEDDVPEDFW
jgi:poly(A) polymerase